MSNLGVYVGNYPQRVYEFESWMGGKVDQILAFIGHQSWADFTGCAEWAADTVWNQIDRPVIWSVPLIVNGANLGDAAAGAPAGAGHQGYVLRVGHGISLRAVDRGWRGRSVPGTRPRRRCAC
jgi:hypothetical protein